MLLPFVCIAAATSIDVRPIQLDGVLCHPRLLLVRAAESGTFDRVRASGARIVRTIPEIGYAVVEAPQGHLQDCKARLANLAGITSVELDRAGQVAYTPNDTYWPNMWHPTAINVDKAWDTSLGTNVPIVAVLDTGVQIDHPDLAANVWVNTHEIPNNGIDDDGNGYVDDVDGYDFAYNDGQPDDQYGHGTACAGLAAAVGDNLTGVIGVAPKARIMALKVANNSGYFYASATVPAYIYGAKMGARVYSMSYYADGVQPAEEVALKWAADHGVLPVAAAGNDSTVYNYYPGAYQFVLSVAALNTDLSKAGFSDYGTWVHVASPGVSLYTTAIGSNYTGGFAGTSGACPIVSGLAALLMGANPSATAQQVKAAIEDTATLQNQAPYGEFSNYGLIDAHAAMTAITGSAAARKPALVRWVSPIGALPTPTSPRVIARAYGRTLDAASVQMNGRTLTRTGAGREWTDFALPTQSGLLTVKSGTSLLTSLYPPIKAGYAYPMIEASSPDSTVTGGFFETLRNDGQLLKCASNGSANVFLQATFKNLPKSGRFTLVIDRRYTQRNSDGTEQLELYNWRAASYPYANFVILRTVTTPTSFRQDQIPIADISPYVDFDGTAYFRIETNGFPSASELQIDSCYLVPR